jgi:hypothetical protein
MSLSFGSTVTNGIQEISALLPLLGTEQCEEHTGSALGKGYLYTGITTISIFGSLGIVKAGFNVLFAAIIVRSWKFLGAQRLADGGFRPKGTAAQLIALDPQNPHRFLAESNLEKILEDAHIDNVEDLLVDWAAGSMSWNIWMAFSTFIVSALGITPYLFFILRTKSTFFLSGWGFPVARLIGSSLAGVLIQIILQIRILVIVKNRLIFLTIDRYIKAPPAQNGLDQHHIRKFHECLPDWDAGQTSEMCLWDLQTFLESLDKGEPTSVPHGQSAPDTNGSSLGDAVQSTPLYDINKRYNFSPLHKYVKSIRRRHFPKFGYLSLTLPDMLHSWLYFILYVVLAVALIISVAGYIGSFTLVQKGTQGGVGPILWLVLEIVLCVLRLVVWAWNPAWDDNQGLTFTISLASKSPLVTCNIYGHELESITEAPVMRSQTFLKEIASYTGPLPAFRWNDAVLYYILTGSDHSGPAAPNKALYIVVVAFKEQTSRLVVKRNIRDNFSFFVSELKAIAHSTNITISTQQTSDIERKLGPTKPETHVLTSDPEFMKQLSNHYDTILHHINLVDHQSHRTFASDWAMQRKNIDLAPVEHPTQPNLTSADIEYLNQGRLETRRQTYAKRLETWIDNCLEVFETELLEQVDYNTHNPMTKHEGIETNEVEYLIFEARCHMEQLLLETFYAWRQLIMTNHIAMVENVIAFFDSSPELSPTTVPAPTMNPIEKLCNRLHSERYSTLERFSSQDHKRMVYRLDAHSDSARERISKRKYLDPKEGNRIVDQWHKRSRLNDVWKGYLISSSNPDFPSFGTTLNTQESASSLGYTVNGLAEKYDMDMSKRLESKERFLRSSDGKELRDRAQQRLNQWKAKLKINIDEFGMVAHPDFLPKVSLPSREFNFHRKYWSVPAITQRLSLMDCHMKYVIISDELLDNLGGFGNLALALKQSQASILYFKCRILPDQAANGIPVQRLGATGAISDLANGHGRLGRDSIISNIETEIDPTSDSDYDPDVNDIDSPLDGEIQIPPLLSQDTMRAIVGSTPSITGVHFHDKMCHLSNAINGVIEKNHEALLAKTGTQMICEYENIEITDYFRRNRPYILLEHSRHAKCTVKFYIEEEADYTLTLKHAFTSLAAEIDINLNKRRLAKSKGSRFPTINDFYDEQISIPQNRIHLRPTLNILTIQLTYGLEPYDYFLSDITLDKGPKGPVCKLFFQLKTLRYKLNFSMHKIPTTSPRNQSLLFSSFTKFLQLHNETCNKIIILSIIYNAHMFSPRSFA